MSYSHVVGTVSLWNTQEKLDTTWRMHHLLANTEINVNCVSRCWKPVANPVEDRNCLKTVLTVIRRPLFFLSQLINPNLWETSIPKSQKQLLSFSHEAHYSLIDVEHICLLM